MNEATKKYTYHLSYDAPKAHPEGISVKELKAANKSGSDALFTASILYPPDGSLSILFSSLDGRTGEELDDNEWFKVFTLLSRRLGLSKTLDVDKRDFARTVFEAFQQAIMGSHCGDPNCTAHHNETPPPGPTH